LPNNNSLGPQLGSHKIPKKIPNPKRSTWPSVHFYTNVTFVLPSTPISMFTVETVKYGNTCESAEVRKYE
jgi:hypothetical protein